MLTIAEIRGRAHGFVNEWHGETREAAERQSFWNDWFDIFGIRRRRLVAFEHHVKKLSGTSGAIDVFWPGKILVEHKSAGEDLDKAMVQAEGYLAGLSEGALPRLVVLSDFARFRVRDLDTAAEHEFSLEQLPERVELFTYLAGYRARVYQDQDVVNVEAAELMGRIYDVLYASGYHGHHLRVLLVRLLFVLFADDSGVWETGLFEEYLEQRTSLDARDLGMHLGALFQVLDTPDADRQSTLDEGIRAFPYINGRLFAEPLPLASFDVTTRARLLEACRFNWSAISPAIFGSMFQSIMKADERRALGAHYTTEHNILKVIDPLFLDELRDELEGCRTDRNKLTVFRAKLTHLRFFDPACGCGNFLIIAYRELRRLELEVRRRLRTLDRRVAQGQLTLDASMLSAVDVDQFYGIEIEEFPARIAEVAMYLMDHLANQELSQEFGMYYTRFPLQSGAHIHIGNALTIDWNDVVPASDCDYVFGNPPFIAKKRRSTAQVQEMADVFELAKNHGELDYVAGWFERASTYIAGRSARVGFVATNSVVQGEQVPALWPRLLDRNMAIDFAHRTFKWTSEARGRAVVHVVIVGFSEGGQRPAKLLYDYEIPTSTPHERVVEVINPYLAEGPNIIVQPRRSTLSPATAPIAFGSMPNDGGSLLLKPAERDVIIATDLIAAKYIRPLLGSDGLFDGSKRWCLWLVDAAPTDLRNSPVLKARIAGTFKHRNDSTRAATKKLAATPSLFGEIRQPKTRYLCVPRHSSETRRYVPMVFAEPDVIAHDSTLTVSGADDYLFGLLHSAMWMAWVRSIGGRIKSDYRISAELVYNTFPWPDTPSGPARARVEAAARAVQAARNAHPVATLADLYSPLAMPPNLVAAHRQLDRSVDALYGRGSFDEIKRLARLLERHQAIQGGLPVEPKPARRRRA